jgi:uncharacterized protein (DUF1800 family)
VAKRPSNAAWTEAHVRRLLWRAGFGATPEEAKRWTAAGKGATLDWLLDSRSKKLVGPTPRVEGRALDPGNEWGHDVLWWLDRMVRSQRPLDEKLTLFWHDHFATTDQETPLMLRQNQLLRSRGLGRFPDLLRGVTTDWAMQLFLSLTDSTKEAPNENFARELMELFTLGAGYTERDVREAARALTGFEGTWGDNGLKRIRYNPERHDSGAKRILGKRGRFDWNDVLDLVVAHPRHAPFLVSKLWGFFVAGPPSKAKVKALARVYRGSGLKIKPVVRAILADPALYADLDGPDMVKAPIVFVAGSLRTTGRGVDTDAWVWLMDGMGQLLFRPPSVAGWDWGTAWMSSNTMRTRFQAANYFAQLPGITVPEGGGNPDAKPDQQLAAALRATGEPWISSATRASLTGLAARFFDDLNEEWELGEPRQTRADHLQRVLRHLLLAGPDAHLH